MSDKMIADKDSLLFFKGDDMNWSDLTAENYEPDKNTYDLQFPDCSSCDGKAVSPLPPLVGLRCNKCGQVIEGQDFSK